MTRQILEAVLAHEVGFRGPSSVETSGGGHPVADADAPFAVAPHESIRAAARRMLEQDLSCLVVATSGSPHGLLLDWSLVAAVLCLQLDGAQAVDTIRWHPFVAAREGGRMSEAAWLMESHAIRHLPLTDDAGGIVGVLSVEDAFARVLDELTALVASTREGVAAAIGGDGHPRRVTLRASDVRTPVTTLDASASARAVAERLCVTASEALVVVDADRPIGIVCERALLARFVAGRASPASVRAGDLVERPFACVAPEDPVDQVLAQMVRSGRRQIVVGSDRGSFGIVTLRELISQLVLELAARLPFAPPRHAGVGALPPRS